MPDQPWKVGDRCVVELFHPGRPPRPYDAPGTLVRIENGHLGHVRLDDRRHGERVIGVQHLRPEASSCP